MGISGATRPVLAALTLAFAAVVAHAETAASDVAASAASAADKAAQAAGKSASAAAGSAQAAASAASSAENAAHSVWSAPNVWVLYLVPAFVLVASLVAIRKIVAALLPTKWSLADALSEDVMMPVHTETVPAGGGAPEKMPVLDNDKKPILVPEMHASSSRVIALMGMMAILFLFLGFGMFAVFEFGAAGKVPDSIDGVVKFLTSGLTLFAPYLVNQFASVFKVTPAGK